MSEDDPEYIEACKDDPEGMNCAKCGEKNEFYDDCGWFYTNIKSKYSAICEKCWTFLGCRTAER